MEDAGGNHERVGYVFDRRNCTFTGLAGNANEPRKKGKTAAAEYIPEQSWWRKPFMASFRSGNFDFITLTTHIRWGSIEKNRAIELSMLAKYVKARTSKNSDIDKDIIVMGISTSHPSIPALHGRAGGGAADACQSRGHHREQPRQEQTL